MLGKNLTQAERDKWHNAITGKGWGYQRILEEGRKSFRGEG